MISRKDLCSHTLEYHPFTFTFGDRAAEGLITLTQKALGTESALWTFSREARITLKNPDQASPIAAMEIHYNLYASVLAKSDVQEVRFMKTQKNDAAFSLLPRYPEEIRSYTDARKMFRDMKLYKHLMTQLPAIEAHFGESALSGAYQPHQRLFPQDRRCEWSILIARWEESYLREERILDGIQQLEDATILSEDPKIRDLFKDYAEKLLKGTLISQQVELTRVGAVQGLLPGSHLH